MKIIIQTLMLTAVMLSISGVALAVTPTVTPGNKTPTVTGDTVSLDNPIGTNDINEFFGMIIDVVLIFAVPIIVFFIIYAGFLYVTARGNESTISKAHMALLYAVIGGVLILGAKVLIEVVQGTVDEIKEEAVVHKSIAYDHKLR